MIAFLFTPLGRASIVALMVLTLAGGIYWAGKNADEIDTLKDTVKAHETRDDIDAAVRGTALYGRCIEFGGLPDRCAELRGLEKAPEPGKPGRVRP